MKAIINVERTKKNFIKHIRCDGTNIYLYERDVEIIDDNITKCGEELMSQAEYNTKEQKEDPLLTEEQFKRIVNFSDNYRFWDEMIKAAKERGWIKKSKRQEFEDCYDKYRYENLVIIKEAFHELYNKAIAAIKEVEND